MFVDIPNMPHQTRPLLALLLMFFASCVAVPPPQASLPPATSPDPSFVPVRGVTVPAGTIFMVRMYDSVDTVHHKAGHRWTATLEANLSADGQTVAPRGSVVYGVIEQAESAGRLVGKSSLVLQPTSILIGSDMFPIVSGEIKAVASSGAGKNTLGRTARGAAIGALIGGSDGAATGAKVGLGASLLSKSGQVQVPAGTLLEFPLAQALTF